MVVSENIPLNYEDIINEISKRQAAPWNNGRINDYNEFPTLQKLFSIINSGIPREDFFFSGDLFRIHTPYITCEDSVNTGKEKIISKICIDGSCMALPITEYSNKLVAYSKSPDFTNHKVFYKVAPSKKAVLLHANTREYYGIDINCFLHRYGIYTRYEGEQEVLFPIEHKFLVKEYYGTPNKFKYYLRKYIIKNELGWQGNYI